MKGTVMKFSVASLIGLGFLATNALADTQVASYGISPQSGSCSWQLTSSSGYGTGAPQFYALNCSGVSNVVSLMTVGGNCNTISSVKEGYRLEGSGCTTKVMRIEATPVVVPVTPPGQCANTNKGKTYFSGPTYIASSIMSGNSATSFCGDCKVLLSGSSNGYSTISCSLYP
jgi:hypothetical protein